MHEILLTVLELNLDISLQTRTECVLRDTIVEKKENTLVAMLFHLIKFLLKQ